MKQTIVYCTIKWYEVHTDIGTSQNVSLVQSCDICYLPLRRLRNEKYQIWDQLGQRVKPCLKTKYPGLVGSPNPNIQEIETDGLRWIWG